MPIVDEREPGEVAGSPPAGARTPAAVWAERAFQRLQDDRVCWLLVGVAMAIYAALAMWLTRGTTIFVDEINVFTVDRGFHLHALLSPLNGHLVLLQRLVFAANFKLFGASFVVPRLVEVAGAAVAVGLFFELVRRRIGGAAALAPSVLLLFLGSAWELNFVVSGIGNVYAVAAGLGAVLAVERADRRGDIAACALLVVAVASFSSGLAFVVGVAVLILLQPQPRRRLWIPLVPVVLYGAWLVWLRSIGESQHLHPANVLLLPNFIADEASTLAGALAGLNYDFQHGPLWFFSSESPYGPILAVAGAIALVVRLRRGPRSPVLWASIATLFAFWVSLGAGYDLIIGRTPTVVRYVYAAAFMALLIGAESVRGWRPRPRALVALYAIAVLALGANIARLRDGTSFYRVFATSLRGELTAVELTRDRVNYYFVPRPLAYLAPLPAGPYLAAVDRVGSPAYSPRELRRQSDAVRHIADQVLISAQGIAVRPAPAGAPTSPCRVVRGSSSAPLSFPIAPPGVRLSASSRVGVALRRFASRQTEPVGQVASGTSGDLRITADRSASAWHAVVTPASATLRICSLRGA